MVSRTATLHGSNPYDVAGSPLSESVTQFRDAPVSAGAG